MHRRREVLALRGTPTRLHLASCWSRAATPATWTRHSGAGWDTVEPAAVPPQWPGIDAAIGAIPAAGRIGGAGPSAALQALRRGALRELCGEFRDAGGEGIEVSLPGMSPQDAGRVASLARRYGLAGSCGSDFHVPGLPWRPLGRFAKLPEGVVPITERLLAPPGDRRVATHAQRHHEGLRR